jgi:hypothetical protein
MATVVRREIRKRGFFGQLFKIGFVGFNIIMLVWLFSYWGSLANMHTVSSAERTGQAIGGTIGTGLLVFFWVAGAVILGLFTILTRGQRTIIEES